MDQCEQYELHVAKGSALTVLVATDTLADVLVVAVDDSAVMGAVVVEAVAIAAVLAAALPVEIAAAATWSP